MLNSKLTQEIVELFAMMVKVVLLAAPDIYFGKFFTFCMKLSCKIEIIVLGTVKLTRACKIVTKNALPFVNGAVSSNVCNIKCARKRAYTAKTLGICKRDLHRSIAAHRKTCDKVILSLA